MGDTSAGGRRKGMNAPTRVAKPNRKPISGAGMPAHNQTLTAPAARETMTGPRPKARTGRPPGIPNRDARLKDKTSLAIDLELMDRYRKQSWKEECQLGELVERALREYASQTWGWDQAAPKR